MYERLKLLWLLKNFRLGVSWQQMCQRTVIHKNSFLSQKECAVVRNRKESYSKWRVMSTNVTDFYVLNADSGRWADTPKRRALISYTADRSTRNTTIRASEFSVLYTIKRIYPRQFNQYLHAWRILLWKWWLSNVHVRDENSFQAQIHTLHTGATTQWSQYEQGRPWSGASPRWVTLSIHGVAPVEPI